MQGCKHISITLALLAAITATAGAQPAEDVLTRIPDDVLGFVAVRNVGAAGTNLSRFVNEVTMDQFPGNLLEMLKMRLRLGPAFNDNGGFAFMMLDPATFGLSVEQMDEDRLLAMLLPGNEPARIFEAYMPTVEGEYVVVNLGGNDTYAKPLGGYTVLSPDKGTIDAVIAATGSMARTIPAAHRDLYAVNDGILHINIERAAPLLAEVLDGLGEQMQDMGPGPGMGPGPAQALAMYSKMLSVVKDFLDQTRAFSLAANFGLDAVRFDSLVTFKPGSTLGAAVAAVRRPAGPLLDKLPALPYVVVAGGSWEGASKAIAAVQKEFTRKILEATVATGTAGAMTDEQTKRYLALVESMAARMNGVRMYVGPPPPGAPGVMALGFVMQVDDANAMMAEFPESIELGRMAGEAMLRDMPGMPKTTMEYVRNVMTVEGVSVDVLKQTMTYPPGAEKMAEQTRKMMRSFYGLESMDVYMAVIDNKTAVGSFGGGEAFLAEVIRAARSGGDLANDPNITQAMALLPRKPSVVAMLNAGNLLELIKNTVRAMAKPEQLDQVMGILGVLQIRTTTPAAYGLATEGAGVYQTVAIPNTLAADIYQNYMLAMQMLMQQMMQQMQQQQGPGGGFGAPPGGEFEIKPPKPQPVQPAPRQDF